MLLRLLYHQQQAIQVQLNTMTEWMQQVNHRIATVERLMRTSRSLVNTAVPSGAGFGPRSYSGQLPSRSTSAAEGYAPMSHPHLNSHPGPIESLEQASAEGPHAHPSGRGSSAYSGQSHPTSSGLAVSSVLEGSQACTPPSEQTRHHGGTAGGNGGNAGSSAVPSTNRSYESALAAPWDPHNASQQSLNAAVHSRTSSSHTSALGRRANPLLNSSGAKSRLPASAAAARSSLGGAGAASAATTAEAPQPSAQPRQPPVVSPPTTAPLNAVDPAAATSIAVPPYRRVFTETTAAAAFTMARQPLSHVTAVARRAPPTSTLADVAETRSGREGTLPPPPHRTATSHNSSFAPGDGQSSAAAANQDSTDQAQDTISSASRSAALAAVHADPATSGEGGGAARSRPEAPHHVVADDDDLSDGYGSYESRMYMKKLGLL
jgi:hypothetical protein